jgi:hypothetical protein
MGSTGNVRQPPSSRGRVLEPVDSHHLHLILVDFDPKPSQFGNDPLVGDVQTQPFQDDSNDSSLVPAETGHDSMLLPTHGSLIPGVIAA